MRTHRSTALIRDAAGDFAIGLLIFSAVFALAVMDSRQAWPAPADATLSTAFYRTDANPLPQTKKSSSIRTGVKIAQLGRSRPVSTPLGTSPNNRMGAIAAMALFFAAMCAVTMGFWRHIRRAYASPRRK